MSNESPYLYCGVCHCIYGDDERDGDKMMLTSCAHVVCKSHIKKGYEKRCPKCRQDNVSFIKIDKGNMPMNLNNMIEPIFEQISNLEICSRFQYLQTNELIKYYQDENRSLKEKNNRMKELLRKSKTELDKCKLYQSEIKKLTGEVLKLNVKLREKEMEKGNTRSDERGGKDTEEEISEISVDEFRASTSSKSRSGNGNGNGKGSGTDREGIEFMNKLKKFSQQKREDRLPRIELMRESSDGLSVAESSRRNIGTSLGLHSFNIQAESTVRKHTGSDRSASMIVPHRTSVTSKRQSSGRISTGVSLNSGTGGSSWYKVFKEKERKREDVVTSDTVKGKALRQFQFKPPAEHAQTRFRFEKSYGSNSSSSSSSTSKTGFGGVLRSSRDVFNKNG